MGRFEGTQTEAGVAAELALALQEDALHESLGLMTVAGTGGREVKDILPALERQEPGPRVKNFERVAGSLESFVEGVLRWDCGNTVVWVDVPPTKMVATAPPEFVAVFDTDAGDGQGLWGRQVLKWSPLLSREWVFWVHLMGCSWMDQGEFAEAIEAEITSVSMPPAEGEDGYELGRLLGLEWGGPPEVMAVSRKLEVLRDQSASGSVDLATGRRTVTYDDGEAKTNVRVPGLFRVAVPYLDRGEAWNVPMKLRFKGRSNIQWMAVAHRPDRVADAVISECVAALRSGAPEVPVMFGKPGTVKPTPMWRGQ